MCLEMTETDRAVIEAGRFVSENFRKMDVSKRIIRNLEPARPLRRLNMNQGILIVVPQSYAEIKPVEKPDNIIKVEHFYEILHLQSTNTQPKKKAERICYTREFLIKLASCPMSKKKPEFLPEHPIVLENGRTNDVPRYFITNHNNNEEMAA
ncbi:uncharacterized protein C8orf88 homolog isoform X1 [Labeo rohita]|uniref:uncharacterized protein C8orf88 homolog isoform X1 n=2 Tax=Labeo rohita TaxID=84645 RepID=UPI0021E34509|nr:uncharacterized protein C8orf88 homolog isoform X1 [Labeo rohita]XP_050987600.1 uncharacterized protein C8orf88 homolog isoform X1 [Labeo rohita]XP_050987601.1 uncharacterized protein C8orf88 homolog isoform X1 [Labeo rohita]XP_050987602.1 uncharacterized protein C8orf88 homolog isoform X1 [Labeo rohita]XP_050987603.1 uncharacterized protein C8orf88 homolog isoform X1 [Labeo rohita]